MFPVRGLSPHAQQEAAGQDGEQERDRCDGRDVGVGVAQPRLAELEEEVDRRRQENHGRFGNEREAEDGTPALSMGAPVVGDRREFSLTEVGRTHRTLMETPVPMSAAHA